MLKLYKHFPHSMNFSRITCGCILLLLICLSWTCSKTPGNVESPEAVKEVLDGTRIEANAAWWGFDETDATEALQSAINSGAKKLIVPNMGKAWNVRPIKLADNQEIIFEKGTVITAKKGEYKGGGECLFRAANVDSLSLSGYGAVFRMQKNDYMTDDYKKAEWRHTLSLISCNNIKVYGLTLKDSGGDGIYIGVSGEQKFCKNIQLKDVVCDNNHRQGISVISVEDMLVENCSFINTWGTPPAAGIDFEPNHPDEKLSNCIFRNCVFKDNEGAGIAFDISHLRAPKEISILFENCSVTSKKPVKLSVNQPEWHRNRMASGISLGRIKGYGPMGLVEFKNCVMENLWGVGLYIIDKSADRALVRFTDCTWKNVAIDNESEAPRVPFWFNLKGPKDTRKPGGVEFVNCLLEDTKNRPFLILTEKDSSYGLYDITGNIVVRNPYGALMDIGPVSHEITLEVKGQ